jgi:hypothetical protein
MLIGCCCTTIPVQIRRMTKPVGNGVAFFGDESGTWVDAGGSSVDTIYRIRFSTSPGDVVQTMPVRIQMNWSGYPANGIGGDPHREIQRPDFVVQISDHLIADVSHVKFALKSLSIPHHDIGSLAGGLTGQIRAYRVMKQSGAGGAITPITAVHQVNATMSSRYPSSAWLRYGQPIVATEFTDTVTRSDRLYFDVWLTLTTNSSGYSPLADAATCRTFPTRPVINNGGITYDGSSVRPVPENRYKVKFIGANPGGLSEIVLGATAGWTYSNVAGVITMQQIAAPRDGIQFHYAKETPYIIVYMPSFNSGTNPVESYVRYHVLDTGDYAGFDNGRAIGPPGVWNPAASETVFRTPGRLYTYATSQPDVIVGYIGSDYPSSVTLEKIN